MSQVSTPSNPYAKAGIAKLAAKRVLYGLQRVLPSKIYDAIYFPSFRLYHASQIRDYRKGVEKLERQGADHAAVVRGQAVAAVMPHSLIGASGLEHTYDLAYDLCTRGIPGAFVECGVAQGGCAALIAKVAAADTTQRHCWFFDSYEGLPDPTGEDFQDGKTGDHIRPLPPGSCLGTIEQVSKLLFEQMGLAREDVTLVKGWFQDTLPVTSSQVGEIALLRVDGDWYDSTMCCFENLYDQVSGGGFIIVDDYFSCYGAQKATDEFLARRGINPTLVSDGRGGCSFQKPHQNAATVKVA